MATQVNASTVGGAAIKDGNIKLASNRRDTYTRRYCRTLQHYITNDNASSTPATIIAPAGAQRRFGILQGFHYIPFNWFDTAMTATDRDGLRSGAAFYRIVDQGFKIVRFNVCQETVANNASATEIRTTFVQAPCAILVEDEHDDLFQSIFSTAYTAANIDATNIPMVLDLTNSRCNGVSAQGFGYTSPFTSYVNPPTIQGGTLPTVAYHGTVPATVAPAPQWVDLMNYGKTTILQTGQEYEYNWVNPNKEKYSPAYVGGGEGTWNETVQQNSCYYGLTTATDVAQQKFSQPHMHLIRVPPLANIVGGIKVVCELWIEYHLTLEIQEGGFLYTRGIWTTAANSMDDEIAVIAPWPTNFRETLDYRFGGAGSGIGNPQRRGMEPAPALELRRSRRLQGTDPEIDEDLSDIVAGKKKTTTSRPQPSVQRGIIKKPVAGPSKLQGIKTPTHPILKRVARLDVETVQGSSQESD
uniref:Uncharacterized protein n=1 Tax=Emberiza spodocephala parvoviridae sp. TaxID=2794481 RepID=A0A8A4XDI1_9VIRU|nr:MAG: hypothetical protein [Emberiza spodocephala parvoviridae sp.]